MIRDQEILESILDTVRRFVAEELVPREAEVAANDAIPADIAAQMRTMGLFGMTNSAASA